MSGAAEIVVVGAGVSGLACARALSAGGRRARVLERARGVGGRCATRRVEGQPVDLGVAFLHGQDAGFLAALDEVPGGRLPGWPSDVHGSGRPCQPQAFQPGERRLAWAEGVTALPRHLARGLDVRTGARVTGLDLGGPRPRAILEDGEVLAGTALVLALAPEQVLRLLAALEGPPPIVATARAILEMSASEPTLTLAALYPAGSPAPAWHVSYPEESRVLQLVAHDSSKRDAPGQLALVLQAHPRWSRDHLEVAAWPELLLEEAARVVGPWARHPVHRHPHRWRYARTGRAGELAAPLLLRLPGGGLLGICGDRFAPGGGVEAAWLSGRALAGMILAEEDS
jgi:hypothetical protein